MNAPSEINIAALRAADAEPPIVQLVSNDRTYRIVLPDQASDYIQKKIAAERKPYELEMLQDMRQRLAPGDLVLDIGANVGNHTLYLAAVAACQVVAFEPNRHLCGALLSSVELNGLSQQVRVRALALGRSAGAGRFAEEMPENLGGQRIDAGRGDIPIAALDSFTFEQTVKVMKVDVEGMELDVLLGAALMIKRDRPALYVECLTEAVFREVSGCLEGLGYSYWDTFNASPTHLFLPNEQLSIEQRLVRLQAKAARDDYRTTQQLSSTRQKLDDANLKYRSANEQIATLKQRLAQEEAARKNGNELAERLKQELDLARHALADLHKEHDVGRGQSHELGIRLAHRESELATQQSRVGELGQAVAKLQEELAAATDDQHLREQSAARLTVDLQRAQQVAADACAARDLAEKALDAARREATEQTATLQARIAALEQQLAGFAADERSRQQETMELLTQLALTRQSAEIAQARLVEDREGYDRDRAAFELQVESLRDRLDAERGAVHAGGLELARREAEMAATQARLEETEARIRESAGELARLGQALDAAGAERASLAAEAQQLRAEASELRESQERDLRAAQERIAEIESVRQRLVGSLADAERSRDEQSAAVQRLATRITELEVDRSTADELDDLRRHFTAQSAELRFVTARRDELTQSHQSATALVAEAREQAERRAGIAERLEAELVELQVLRPQVEDATRRDAANRAECAALQQSLAETQAALVASRRDASRLGSEAETMAALGRAREIELDRMKVDALRAKMSLAEAQTRIEQSRRQAALTQEQAAKTRATLSFQLGHALIFGFKSWYGFKALPSRLVDLRREALRRRENSKPRMVALPLARSDAASQGAARAALLAASAAAAGSASSAAAITPATLKTMKVAAVMDEFTHSSFRDECNLLQLTPAHWKTELETFRPELLLIESAWRGKDELWGNKVGHMSQELQGIVKWCREHRVPTTFWNKEDPVHFETFLSTAKLFDHVFTTDIDCIHRYKAALGHDRVHLLPFACQPRVHNPIEIHERKDAFCFAGAYYAKYPERTRDLGNFVAALPDFKPVEIYDRNFGKNDPNYQFPPEYQPFIVGNLPFDQIDKAYKGYRYAVNLNSIKQSQSMFARRVFELLGSNTITVSNYSRGVRLMFGDLVLTSDSGIELLRRLRERCGDEVAAAKLRLAALRKVMAEHTYQDRLAYLAQKVRGEAVAPLLPAMVVLGYAKSVEQARALADAYAAQTCARKSLVLVVPAGLELPPLPEGTRVVSAAEAQQMLVSSLGTGDEWIAVMVPDDHYGPNYLLDLTLATRYADADVVGKAARYAWSASKGLSLAGAGQQYRRVAAIPVRAGAARLRQLGVNLREWIGSVYTAKYEDERALSIDPFNYCRNGADAGFDDEQRGIVDDLDGIDVGLPLADLLSRAERIAPAPRQEANAPQLDGAALARLFAKGPAGSKVRMVASDAGLAIESTLEDGQHEYWYATADHAPDALGAADGRLKFHLEQTPGLNVQVALLFLDAQSQRISTAVKHGNRNHDVEVPAGTAFVRLGLRVYAAGSARVDALVLGHRMLEPAELMGHGEHLLLTNHYPSNDDLYRNGFVHRRVVAYARRGTRVDVFRLRADEPVSFHEFEDVDCITGSQQALETLLASGRYRHVLVHFLDEAMWAVLKRHIDRVKVTVWVHGAEVQPYHRREYNYSTDAERAVARAQSERRMAFWRGVLKPVPANLRFVFVSRYFAEEVMEDTGVRLPESAYEIIHNPIDTELFRYEPKSADQRKKILSIRPYASAKYANDLSVKAILALSRKPLFKDLEIRMVGDGPLFEQTLAPLCGLPNVAVERRFLSQLEIAQLHREYGVFLSPTRMDAQGVSRDEAMASGLVPITNAVAAIPEFVDSTCGLLAPAEDEMALADAIERIASDPEMFATLSLNASQRVRQQSAEPLICARELAIVQGTRAQ